MDINFKVPFLVLGTTLLLSVFLACGRFKPSNISSLSFSSSVDQSGLTIGTDPVPETKSICETPNAPSSSQSLATRVGAGVVNTSFPLRSASLPWRAEIYIHDWANDLNQFSRIVQSEGLGLDAYVIVPAPNDFRILVINRQTNSQGCQISLAGMKTRAAYIRIQHDPKQSQEICEAWDKDGQRFFNIVSPYSQLTPYSFGSGLLLEGGGISNGFFRIHSNLVPLNSAPPITNDNNNTLVHWKFDGNLDDSSGHGYLAAVKGEPPKYVKTPFQCTVATIKTAGAPAWSNWISLRAGFPNQLSGLASFSQGDFAEPLTYQWTQLAGPTNVIWTNPNSASPTIEGLVFGTYSFRLKVKDARGVEGFQSLNVGAVAMDDNGVVINSDRRADQIYGPMIGFGRNPWGFADERAYQSVKLKKAIYDKEDPSGPSFLQFGSGTVSYYFSGSPKNTTLCAGIPDPSNMSISVCDANQIDLTSFPTRILIGPPGTQEEVRICGASSLTGPATLSVCYDGRGQQSGLGYLVNARAWPLGERIGQFKVSGNGTLFSSDSRSPICPAGIPSVPGRVVYSSGKMSLSPGSALATGVATEWTTTNQVISSYFVRVQAAHGGVPFVFTAPITDILNPSSMNLAKKYPADADSGSFSYQILAYRYLSLGYNRSDGSSGLLLQGVNGCESETALYGIPLHDVPALNSKYFSAMNFSYKDGLGAQSAYGPNFYGEGLAHRAFYLRSGLKIAEEAANHIDEYWIKDPEVDGGFAGGIPLLQGGGVIGAFADLVLNKSTKLSWSDVRTFAAAGAVLSQRECNDIDTRDSGYIAAWTGLAAMFDPDSNFQSKWRSDLAEIYKRDIKCRGSGSALLTNSWANGFYFNSNGPKVNLTANSPIAVGSNIPQSACSGVSSGFVNLTSGSASVTGSGFVTGSQIAITGTKNGATFVGFFSFNLISSSSLSLAALWPGDSGTFSYMISNNENQTVFSTGSSDPQMTKNWVCVWNNSNQIVLNRPWDGPTQSGVSLYTSNLAGFGQQPYMLGIKTFAMGIASHIPGFQTTYSSLAGAAAKWIHDFGYDPVTQGMFYGRIFQGCEPFLTPPAGSNFNYRSPGCNYGLNPDSIRTGRILNAEAMAALRYYFESNPTAQSLSWGDQVYGSLYGYKPYTADGFYADDFYAGAGTNLDDVYLAGYKYTGFFFGMGMAHQWPAVRLGGAMSAKNIISPIELHFPDVPSAQFANVKVTAPSGAKTSYRCFESPCFVEIDERQGAHWIQIAYMNSENKSVANPLSYLLKSEPKTKFWHLASMKAAF